MTDRLQHLALLDHIIGAFVTEPFWDSCLGPKSLLLLAHGPFVSSLNPGKSREIRAFLAHRRGKSKICVGGVAVQH